MSGFAFAFRGEKSAKSAPPAPAIKRAPDRKMDDEDAAAAEAAYNEAIRADIDAALAIVQDAQAAIAALPVLNSGALNAALERCVSALDDLWFQYENR